MFKKLLEGAKWAGILNGIISLSVLAGTFLATTNGSTVWFYQYEVPEELK